MSKSYHDDEWKRVRTPEQGEPTRAEKQARLNADYGYGRITRDEWRSATDLLSEPELQTT